MDLEKLSEINSVLILNKPQVLTKNSFYRKLFKVPEVLNRLRQYRELLSQNNINIPIWVYCLTQDIQTLRGTPQTEVVNFLVSMGLYDRYVSKAGWPNYILGTRSLISVIFGEISFENKSLELASSQKSYQQISSLIRVKSYYNKKTKKFCLTNWIEVMQSPSFKKILEYLESDQEATGKSYKFLCPHKDSLLGYMRSIEISPRDFLEHDEDLRWLWPIWKRTQLYDCHTEKFA